jgi:hypothetical protein
LGDFTAPVCLVDVAFDVTASGANVIVPSGYRRQANGNGIAGERAFFERDFGPGINLVGCAFGTDAGFQDVLLSLLDVRARAL